MNGARPNPPPPIPAGQPRPAGAPNHAGHSHHSTHAPQATHHGPTQQPGGPPKIAPVPVQHAPTAELDPIELIDEPTDGPQTPHTEKKIQYLGVVDSAHRAHKWKRASTVNGTGACRVRSFHGKYSEQGLEYLDGAINDWLDNNPDIEIKFVTSTVMTFEGKIREPALVLNCWY